MTALAWALAMLGAVALLWAFISVYNWGYNDAVRDDIERKAAGILSGF